MIQTIRKRREMICMWISARNRQHDKIENWQISRREKKREWKIMRASWRKVCGWIEDSEYNRWSSLVFILGEEMWKENRFPCMRDFVARVERGWYDKNDEQVYLSLSTTATRRWIGERETEFMFSWLPYRSLRLVPYSEHAGRLEPPLEDLWERRDMKKS